MFDADRFIDQKVRNMDASGIRKVFELAKSMKDPINFSIGQPDFDVPDEVKAVAIKAIEEGFNSYTLTQGCSQIWDKINGRVGEQFPHWKDPGYGTLITSGVSGALMLALLTCVGPGDEVLIPDPYFVMYKHLITLSGATAVCVDTYPDFQITAQRIEPYVTPRTKLLLFNTPSNPTGVVATQASCREVAELAERKDFLILSDEIYDDFCYEKVLVDGQKRCPSPASYTDRVILMRGFSKTYGMTGWRLGYAAGPSAILDQMTKLQQYSFVCAPSMVQLAGAAAIDVDMSQFVHSYAKKRQRVVERLSGHYELTNPGGAFYAFPKVPEHLGLTGSEFVGKAIEKQLLMIPGAIFSERDTHFRISYACSDEQLERGLDVLVDLAKR